MDVLEFREIVQGVRACTMSNRQREQFKRLGVRGDWNNPYLTLNPEYEARTNPSLWPNGKKGIYL